MEIMYLSIVTLSVTIIGFILITSKIHTLRNQQLSNGQAIAQLLVRLEEREKNLKELRDHLTNLVTEQQREQVLQRQRFDEHQLNTLKTLQESLRSGMTDIRMQLVSTLNTNNEALGEKIDKLVNNTDSRLKEISNQVDQRLTDGFEKTNATFIDIIKRLTLIDEAQKKITELSSNVVSLQEILADKKSRGAFGEVQLNNLISNIMPENHYALQFTLSNNKRADAILFLPEPTGNIIIDAKFPLESYRKVINLSLSESDKKLADQQFRSDIKKHINDIAEKYIIAGETSDGAIMFIPAEAVFAEIHSHYSDLVDYAHRYRVWMVSPTTMVAILNTARAVLKDAATRKQVHIIQEHLVQLGRDFERFQKRINNLAKHIEQAHMDVEEVHKSSKKITSRFNKIEKVDFTKETIAIELNETEHLA